MAVTGVLPKLNAFASWNNEVKWDKSVETFGTGGSWTAGLMLNVPLFSGFKNSTAYKESRWDAIKSDLSIKQAKSDLETNLIRIGRFREAARINAVSAKELWDLNRKNLAIMEDRYAAGQIGQLDLIDMQRAVVPVILHMFKKYWKLFPSKLNIVMQQENWRLHNENEKFELLLADLAGTCGNIVGCSATKEVETEAIKEKTVEKIAVEAMMTSRIEIGDTIRASAMVSGINEVMVTSQGSGTIIECPVRLGQSVSHNQILIAVDSDIQKAAYDQAKVARDEAQLNFDAV